jgi:hypothetical protein
MHLDGITVLMNHLFVLSSHLFFVAVLGAKCRAFVIPLSIISSIKRKMTFYLLKYHIIYKYDLRRKARKIKGRLNLVSGRRK